MTTTTERTALSDLAVSLLRTAVPTLWGALVAAVLRWVSPHLPVDVVAALADALGSAWAGSFILGLALLAWYALWRWLEPRIPDALVRLVLGSARMPGYPLPPAIDLDGGAHLVGSLTPDEARLIEDIRKTEGRNAPS